MGNWIYILVILGIIFIILLIASLLQPIVSTMLKVKKYGITINWNEAKELSNFYKLSEDLLLSAKELMAMGANVSIIALADFYRGGGSFEGLKNDFQIALDSGKEVSMGTVILLNLGKKDIKESIDKIDKVYNFKISNIQENDVAVDYELEFKIEYEQAFWLTPDLKALKERVRGRVKLALSHSDLKEEEDLAGYILEHYLNEDFWRVATSAEVIQQELIVRK